MDYLMFLVLNILTLTTASLIDADNRGNVENLTKCVVKIVEEIDLKKFNKHIDITVMNMNDDIQLSALHKIKGIRFVSRTFLWKTKNIDNVAYIVKSEDYQELVSGLKKVTLDVLWNPTANFIIVLNSFGNISLNNVSNLLQEYNIIYKVTLIIRQENDYAIHKFNLTSSSSCIKSKRLTFVSWCSKYHGEESLPKLVHSSNIRNCRFILISQNAWPFVNFDTKCQGIEQNLITLFEKYTGVKIYLREFGKLDRYGNIVANFTKATLDKVEQNEVEGAVGGFSMRQEYTSNLSYSYPILVDSMYVLLPHTNFLGQWEALSRQAAVPFLITGIFFIFFSIAASWLSIFSTRELDVSHDVLVVFGYILNKTVIRNTKPGWPQTLIFTSLLTLAFIIPYTIQAHLYSVTTEPVRAYEPKDIGEIDNFKAILLTQWPERSFFKGHLECKNTLSCLLALKHYPNKSCYTILSNFKYSIYKSQLTDDYCNPVLYSLKEPMVKILRTVYFRRGSVLTHPFSRFVLRAASTGVIIKQISDVFYHEQLKCVSRQQPEDMPLTMENFHFAFCILAVGYIVSLIAFICEVKFKYQCRRFETSC